MREKSRCVQTGSRFATLEVVKKPAKVTTSGSPTVTSATPITPSVAEVVYSGSWDFLYGQCKALFVSELNCVRVAVLHNSLLHVLLQNFDFLNKDISQFSAATRLGCGDFVTNFLLSLAVKTF